MSVSGSVSSPYRIVLGVVLELAQGGPLPLLMVSCIFLRSPISIARIRSHIPHGNYDHGFRGPGLRQGAETPFSMFICGSTKEGP